MPLSAAQQQALQDAHKLLSDAGIATGLLDDITAPPPTTAIRSLVDPPEPSADSGFLVLAYQPTAARPFSASEISRSMHRLNCQTTLTHIVEHPLGAIVEYPQTGANDREAVVHRFVVDAQCFTHPKGNLQYSLGNSHGGHDNVKCGMLLLDNQGRPVPCHHPFPILGRGLKYCSFGAMPTNTVHHDTNKIVFMRTLAIYCALKERGCDVSDPTVNLHVSTEPTAQDPRRRKQPESCSGHILLKYGKYGQPYLECEYRTPTTLAHLSIRDLNEYDIEYLQALLTSNSTAIAKHENVAKHGGYGPLAPCSFVATQSEQKQLCPYWHRDKAGRLHRGILKPSPRKCPSTFDIYTPAELSSCPAVVIVCRHTHSHPPPCPTKTPESVMGVFHGLLFSLDWKLADATPRKLILDSGFMQGLRNHLSWTGQLDPSLAHLHPSFGNLDHVRRCINSLRNEFFPQGTGFEGAKLLLETHQALPLDEQYIRTAESHTLQDGKDFLLVICMTHSMSSHLMRSRHVTIDTSFKRLHGYQEFEIETWDDTHMRSIVSARAFITSQSGEAHLILFQRIFEIAQSDTGINVQFHHIHGDGFRVWVADAHKGQALGIGMFCEQLCRNLFSHCKHEPNRRLRDLNPYNHLKRFYRICVVHFKRNIQDIRPHISEEVRQAMLSLASAEPHSDLEAALNIIRGGGKKAAAWLKDKQEGTKFALPALYRPLSFIPLDIWKSAPSSTNGNEQAHRSINRDGIDMPLLAGIMRGMQYDGRSMTTLELFSTVGIHPQDQLPTPFRRIASALHRKVLVQKRVAMKQSEREHPPSAESDIFSSQPSNPLPHTGYSLQTTSAYSIPAPRITPTTTYNDLFPNFFYTIDSYDNYISGEHPYY